MDSRNNHSPPHVASNGVDMTSRDEWWRQQGVRRDVIVALISPCCWRTSEQSSSENDARNRYVISDDELTDSINRNIGHASSVSILFWCGIWPRNVFITSYSLFRLASASARQCSWLTWKHARDRPAAAETRVEHWRVITGAAAAATAAEKLQWCDTVHRTNSLLYRSVNSTRPDPE